MELKILTNKFNSMLQILKSYEQNLVIRTRNISKNKKTEEEIKKRIKVTEAQIESFQEPKNNINKKKRKWKRN